MSIKLKPYQRLISTAAACAITVVVSISSGLALPAAEPFAEFRIDAAGNDIQDRTISIDLYRRDKKGVFKVDNTVEYTCKVNRATGDASFFIQPQTDGVWVSIDYLTDMDGDGTYELLDGDEAPVWDVMTAQGGLLQARKESEDLHLTSGETYILSPEVLVFRSRSAIQDRTPDGGSPLDVGRGEVARQDFPLCMIKLHRTSPDDGQEYVQTYYLELYDRVLIPSDISPSQPFYDAVEYVLARGYFSGTSTGLFEPEGPLTRAQLAQVLWTMSGSPNAEMCQFSDVAPGSWYYTAVSWCQQEGLISGYTASTFAPGDPLSREQMVSILYRFVTRSATPVPTSISLTAFSDGSSVSSWAADSVRWAVSNSLLSTADNAILPQQTVTRAELASALYSLR